MFQAGNLSGLYGLWFLQKTGGQWVFAPPSQVRSVSALAATYFSIPSSSSPAVLNIASRPSTIGDQIAMEIVAALVSDPIHCDVTGLADGSLGITNGSILTDLYQLLHANSNPDDLRFLGLTGLLRGPFSTQALMEIASNLPILPTLKIDVATFVAAVRNTDPAAIQTLGQIASSSDAGVQRSAARALQAIHTVSTLPFLAQLLSSSDPQTREEAVWGFSKFVDNRPVEVPTPTPGSLLGPQGPTPYQTPDTDRNSPARLPYGGTDAAVPFWKSWWAKMQGQLTGKANP